MPFSWSNLRRLRAALMAVSVFCLIATCVVFWMMWIWVSASPSNESNTPQLTQAQSTPSNASDDALASQGHGTASLSTLRQLWDRPLRAPLYDPPPVVVVTPPPPPPPPLRLKLMGTVIEPDPADSSAIIMAADSSVQMHKVDAVIDNARITSIIDGQIEVLYHDQPQTLTIQP